MEGGVADARVPSSGGLTQKYAGHKERLFVIRFGSLAKGRDPSGVGTLPDAFSTTKLRPS